MNDERYTLRITKWIPNPKYKPRDYADTSSPEGELMTPAFLKRWRSWLNWMTGGQIPPGILNQLEPKDVNVEGNKVSFRFKANLDTSKMRHGVIVNKREKGS